MSAQWLVHFEDSHATTLASEFTLEQDLSIVMIHCEAGGLTTWTVSYEIPDKDEMTWFEQAAEIALFEPTRNLIFPVGTVISVSCTATADPKVLIHCRQAKMSLVQ